MALIDALNSCDVRELSVDEPASPITDARGLGVYKPIAFPRRVSRRVRITCRQYLHRLTLVPIGARLVLASNVSACLE
jgi:hypothetical protein